MKYLLVLIVLFCSCTHKETYEKKMATIIKGKAWPDRCVMITTKGNTIDFTNKRVVLCGNSIERHK